ncbi:hypothetical protein [Romboutsia sp. 13368]|uniref:hypothetical protein n=1 Tax=Romboutsia sp. 13368 TaxID=2708053 RepID=UPI0025EC979B|nr:hypothetical protein [Romboutsia sp. 13368]
MTLVELVITISIILLITTLCFPKDNIEKYQVNSFIKQLCSDIRYVRNINMMGNTNAYVYLEKSDDGSSFKLNENRKDIKQVYLPKDCKIQFTRPIIKFKADGTPLPSGTTIKIIHKNKEIEITIVPISGRVLIKEGKYEI